jgi:hypothetical protein
MTTTTIPALSLWVDTLRSVFRLTEGVDYCWCSRYGELHVLCNSVHTDTIIETAERCGLVLSGVYPYLYRDQNPRATRTVTVAP